MIGVEFLSDLALFAVLMMNVYFSDFFNISEETLENYGAFNISVLVDLPLFIDPFLLFNSTKPEYRRLHDEMIRYLRFLRDWSVGRVVTPGLLSAWYCFKEVKQNWLGFCAGRNSGHGLGSDFARSLHDSLGAIFLDFGQERITKGSHLEKVCLIKPGVGRDTISDFTTNLIKEFLLEYTQTFALRFISAERRRRFAVQKVRFNFETFSWEPRSYELPWDGSDYVLLTPKDILTRDDTWINKEDFFREFEDIPLAIGNAELRAQIDAYFRSMLPRDAQKADQEQAIAKTALKFPELFDYFIKRKEDTGNEAAARSSKKVSISRAIYVEQFRSLIETLSQLTPFYAASPSTRVETRRRIEYLKDVIENKGGYRIFYYDGKPLRRETDLQILYRLVWFASPHDVSREVNDGRGPVDFKISYGAFDKTLVEMKLATNTGLKRNLQSQAEIYQEASDAATAYKVIVYFAAQELEKVRRILRELGLEGHESIILIDARSDNKPSASKASAI